VLVEEKFIIRFPRQAVWDFLMSDVREVLLCMPGVEEVRAVDEGIYQGILRVEVGPISAVFQGNVTVEGIDKADYRASMLATGTDSKLASLAKARIAMNLEQVVEGQTEVIIRADVRILGLLSRFGQGLIRGKAHSLIEGFANRIRARLEQVSTGSAGGE